jgi:hypothetical protein
MAMVIIKAQNPLAANDHQHSHNLTCTAFHERLIKCNNETDMTVEDMLVYVG